MIGLAYAAQERVAERLPFTTARLLGVSGAASGRTETGAVGSETDTPSLAITLTVYKVPLLTAPLGVVNDVVLAATLYVNIDPPLAIVTTNPVYGALNCTVIRPMDADTLTVGVGRMPEMLLR